MNTIKAPTNKELAIETGWTRHYLQVIKESKKRGDYAAAAEAANQISAIWCGIMNQFEEAK